MTNDTVFYAKEYAANNVCCLHLNNLLAFVTLLKNV